MGVKQIAIEVNLPLLGPQFILVW